MSTGSASPRYSGRLKRLDASFYRGKSYVHWTFCTQFPVASKRVPRSATRDCSVGVGSKRVPRSATRESSVAEAGTAFDHRRHNRGRGWLSPAHHAALLDAMRDWLVRYHLCCYGYCLMPDHGHFLLIGLNDRSDQLAFVREFTRAWNQLLGPGHRLMRQGYDTVLREADRQKGAFSELADYIWHNPVRAGLVEDWTRWPFLGCLLPGYPKLDPRKPYFRENFWKGYQDQAD